MPVPHRLARRAAAFKFGGAWPDATLMVRLAGHGAWQVAHSWAAAAQAGAQDGGASSYLGCRFWAPDSESS